MTRSVLLRLLLRVTRLKLPLGRRLLKMCEPAGTPAATLFRMGCTRAGRQRFGVVGDLDEHSHPAAPSRVWHPVGPDGMRLQMAGVACVEVPYGAFRAPAMLSIERTRSAETAEDFNGVAPMLGVRCRADYEIRIRSGRTRPVSDLLVGVMVPFTLSAKLRDGEAPVLLAQAHGVDEMPGGFELVVLGTSPNTRNLRFFLPPALFSSQYSEDGSWEAVLVVAVLGERTAKSLAGRRWAGLL